MFWKAVITWVVLFWAVMSGLLIRDVYFPGHSRFASVPVSRVLDLFLSGPAAFNNTLHILHDEQKLGQVTFNVRKSQEQAMQALYGLLITGSMNPPVNHADAAGVMQAAFHCSAELKNAERWQSLKGEVELPGANLVAQLNWREGLDAPEIEVRKEGRVIMNTAMASGLLGQWVSPPGTGLPDLSSHAKLLPQLTAREGMMHLAGRKRRCHVVTARIQALPGREARLYFTEAGELARVELPGGWRLIEPMMHSLEP